MSESTKITISPSDNGPLRVVGAVTVVDAEGKVIRESKETYLCRCGNSSKKPFCDGSHKEDFESVVRAE